jgi:hypothetical protein
VGGERERDGRGREDDKSAKQCVSQIKECLFIQPCHPSDRQGESILFFLQQETGRSLDAQDRSPLRARRRMTPGARLPDFSWSKHTKMG